MTGHKYFVQIVKTHINYELENCVFSTLHTHTHTYYIYKYLNHILFGVTSINVHTHMPNYRMSKKKEHIKLNKHKERAERKQRKLVIIKKIIGIYTKLNQNSVGTV